MCDPLNIVHTMSGHRATIGPNGLIYRWVSVAVDAEAVGAPLARTDPGHVLRHGRISSTNNAARPGKRVALELVDRRARFLP